MKTTPTSAPTVADRSFMREVDDALHQEKMLNLWQAHRGLIIAGVALLAASVAGWQGWKAYQAHTEKTLAEQFYTWSQLPSHNARLKAIPPLMENSTEGYKALAAFYQAQQLAGTDPTAADLAYGQIYNDKNQPQWLRELARFNAALGLLGRNDTLAQEHLNILVQVQNVADAGPIYPLALEQLTLLAQRNGDLTSARGYNSRLLGLTNLPPDLSQRALMRKGLLSGL